MKGSLSRSFRRSILFYLSLFIIIPINNSFANSSGEFAPFKITGSNGMLAFRYDFSKQLLDQQGETYVGTEKEQTVFEEELNLGFRGFIFHPKFISLDAGGGVLLPQERYRFGETEASSNGKAYNIFLRSSILKDKPYPLHLSYNQNSRIVAQSTGESYLQKSTSYGFFSLLRKPVVPFPLNLKGEILTLKGESQTYRSDMSKKSMSFSTGDMLSGKSVAFLGCSYTGQSSSNGGGPSNLRETTSNIISANFNSRHPLGAQKKALISNRISYSDRDAPLKRRDFGLSPSLLADFTDSLSLYAKYLYSASSDDVSDSSRQTADASIKYLPTPNVSLRGGLNGSLSKSSSVRDASYGTAVNGAYKKNIWGGTVNLTGNGAYTILDRNSYNDFVEVVGEIHTLSGLTPVELKNINIEKSTIAVFNASRTVQYSEGLDYYATVVGKNVFIERAVGGSISPDEEVSVDYRYQSPGTFDAASLHRGCGIRYSPVPALSFTYNLSKSSYQIMSESATVSLDSSERQFYGCDLRLASSWLKFNGSTQYEARHGSISSYNQKSCSLMLQMVSVYKNSLTLTGRRVLRDNVDTSEDQNISEGSLRADVRLNRRLIISLDANLQKDNGSTINSLSREAVLRVNSSYRDLTFSGKGRIMDERQDDYQRTIMSIMIELKRSF